jgi:uncharacterized membrane protein YfcA
VSALNLAVRLACEFVAIAALVWWGWPLPGILAGVAVIVVWGAFIGPKARRRMPDPYRLVLELGIFGLATAGLRDAGQTALAVAFAAAAFVSALLVRVWPEPVG